MATAIATMTNFFNVLKLYSYDNTTDGIAVLDHAIRTTTRFAGLQDAVNHFVSDMASVTATQGAAQSLLQNCGIVLGADNDFTVDTGAVSGYNAGNGVVKDAQTIVPESDVLLSLTALPAAGSRNVHSYTGADGKIFYFSTSYPETYLTVRDNSTSVVGKYGYEDSTFAQSTTLQAGQIYQDSRHHATGEQVAVGIQTLMRGMENFWIEQGLKLAYDSFGVDFNNKNISVVFGINQESQAETEPAASDPYKETELPTSDIEVEINAVMFSTIDPNDPNGNSRVAGGADTNYLDRTIAHELVHAVMQGSGTIKQNMPEFFTEGIAELVHGLDDFDGECTQRIAELAADSARLTQALAFEAGTGTTDAYPAGHMFLRYLCQQALPANVEIGLAAPQVFTHATPQDIISGYKDGDVINLASGVQFTTATFAGGDLFASSNVGNVIVRDARCKLINFADTEGNITARCYAANEAGMIDGRGLDGYKVIHGADLASNEIRAGDSGAQLWGGTYGNDYLHGGAGVDEFIAGVGCGQDSIFGVGAADIINLAATTLDQISNVYVAVGPVESDIMMRFTDGSSLTVWSFPSQTINFKLADGSTYSHDNATDTWTKTN